MTNPLTTPSGVEQSIPIPRNADGSPMTKAQARIIRARTIQKQVLAGQAGAVAEATSDEARSRPQREKTGDHSRLYDDAVEKGIVKPDAYANPARPEGPDGWGEYNPPGVTADGREGPKLARDTVDTEISLEEAEKRLAEADKAHEEELTSPHPDWSEKDQAAWDTREASAGEPVDAEGRTASERAQELRDQVVSATPHELGLPEGFQQDEVPVNAQVETEGEEETPGGDDDPVLRKAVDGYLDAKSQEVTPNAQVETPEKAYEVTGIREATPEEIAKAEAEKVKPENPRQPAKKTPAQKRAETIAAKKAAAEKGNA